MNKTIVNTNLLILMICMFVVTLGYGVLLPVLPFFIERLTNISPDNIAIHFGILTAIYPVTMVFSAPFLGRIADKIGPRTLIIIGLSGFVVMQVMIGLSTTLFMLYIARIVGSLLSSFLFPVINMHIGMITKKANRRKAMAWSGTAVSTGIIVGPAISGLLAENGLHVNWTFGHFYINSLSVPFFLLALGGVVVMVFALIFLKSPQQVPQPQLQKPFELPLKMQWKAIGNLLILSLILQFSLTMFESVFTLYASDVGGHSTSFIATGLLVCGAVMAIFQPVLAKWGEQVLAGESHQIIGGFILSGIALLIFVTGIRPWMTLSFIGLFALGISFIVPNLLSAVTLKTHSSGNALGWQYSFNGIGQIIGPVGGTAIYAVNKNAPFLMGGLILIGVAIYQIKHLKKS